MRRRFTVLLTLCAAAGLAAMARAADWPQFRGPQRDNIARETGLLRQWPDGGPKVLWTVEACQGYAAAAIVAGRVYFNDYDRDAKEWSVRCLTLTDGKELWRFRESKTIRPNHGITRTTPAVAGGRVFTLDPKCIFHCLDAETGKELWRKDLVADYQAQIPPWYNGQNPLLDGDRVVLGVGGAALIVAFDQATGRELWRTPNPENWPLSHASVMPAELGGVKQYLWCTLFGVLGVRADDGTLLWHHARKFNVAVAPSPLAIPPDRVFMTSGYDAGTVMIRVKNDGGKFSTETVFELTTEEWNSEVHTPILYEDHLFAVGKKQRGLFTCLDLDGKIVWTSAGHADFDLGSFLLVDGLIFALEGKTGLLRLLEANTQEYRELAHAQVLNGDNVWGPMALSDGKLVLRDMTKMVCIEVGQPAAKSASVGRGAGLGRVNCLLLLAAGDEPKVAYRQLRVIGGRGAGPGQFADELRGLAIDAQDRIYAVGDSKLAILLPEGKFLRGWDTQKPGYCVAVAADGRVFVGEERQIEVFDETGRLLDTWADPERLGLVTAIGFVRGEVVIADTRDRCLRRYDPRGQWRGDLGNDNRMRGFLVPNRHLDFASDAQGTLHAANAGMHRVQRFNLEGELLGQWGRFDGQDPAGFPGCCNPTNIALTRDGHIVVTEKAGPRVKVYNPTGELLTVVATDDFEPNCKNMDIAVDSHDRIYVADTVRLEIRVYEPVPSSQPTSAPAAAEVPQ